MMILKKMLQVTREIEKFVVEIRPLTIELVVLWRSTALEMSRFGRLKLETAEQKGSMMRRLEIICNPAYDDRG